MRPPVATADERGPSMDGHALTNRLSSRENITSKWALDPVTIINSHAQDGIQLEREVQDVSTKRRMRIRPKHYQFVIMTSEAPCRWTCEQLRYP